MRFGPVFASLSTVLLILADTSSAVEPPRPKPTPSAKRDFGPPPPPPPRAAPVPRGGFWTPEKGGQLADTTRADTEQACRAGLGARKVAYAPLPTIDDAGNCGIAAPLRVTAINGVKLSTPAILNCRTTAAVDDWLTAVVRPAARRYLRTAPVSMNVAASYVCRTRNRRPGARISEHAFGNAIDIRGLGLADGSRFAVGAPENNGTARARFEAALRTGACDHFTTILGPGSDSAHTDHFHFDLRDRRPGYRYCR